MRAGRRLAVAFGAACLLIGPAVPSQAEMHQLQVLVISAGDTTLPASVAIIKGLTATLSDAGEPPEVFVEYLDGYRFPFDEASARLKRTLVEKYSGLRPALLVAVGIEALDFLDAHSTLFGASTPIALGAVLSDTHPGVQPRPHVAGVLGRVFIGRTLLLATRLQPESRRLVVVAGAAPLDRRLLAVTREHLAGMAERLDVTELVGLPLPELGEALGRLPPDAMVLYLSMFRDDAGTIYTSRTVAQFVAAASPAPVYSIYDTAIGRGAAAGYVDRLELLGNQLGDVVLRIIGGEDPAAIGILDSTTPATLVDWGEFEKAGLDAGLLPDDSIMLNRPATIWESHRPQIIVLGLVFLCMTVLLVVLLWERRRRIESEASLRLLAGSVLSARDEERRRIARELHDATGQNITVAALVLEKIRAKLPGEAQADADELAAALSSSMREIRTLSYVLHPPLLDEAGLCSALPHFVGEFSKRSGIAVGLDIDGALERLEPDAELTLFRIVQEGLTNVSRHSGSGAAHIRLWLSESNTSPSVLLRIEDEGRGFPGIQKDPTVRNVDARSSGVGLAGMEERLRLLGGRLRIVSGAGSTIVIAEIPIRSQQGLPAE